MRETALYGTAVAVVATAANWVHSVAHAEHQVPLAAWQWAYVISVIFLVPIAASILLWTRFRRAGAWLLPFQVSAALVTLISGVGCLVGIRLLRVLPRSPADRKRLTVKPAGPRQGPGTGSR